MPLCPRLVGAVSCVLRHYTPAIHSSFTTASRRPTGVLSNVSANEISDLSVRLNPQQRICQSHYHTHITYLSSYLSHKLNDTVYLGQVLLLQLADKLLSHRPLSTTLCNPLYRVHHTVQDRQRTKNVTLSRVRKTIVAVGKQ